MAVFRLKHSFNAGELSPLMDSRVDFTRFNNGCRRMWNMRCMTQGPATRREGTQFIYDLNLLGLDPANPEIRAIPFIFNELQAYVLFFFRHTDGDCRMVIATDEGLVTYSDPVIEFCPPEALGSVTYSNTNGVDIDLNTDYTDEGEIEVRWVPNSNPENFVVLDNPADYTITRNDPLPHTISVRSGLGGAATIEVWKKPPPGTAPGDIVVLTIPGEWDLEEFDWAQSADEMYIAQSGVPPQIIKRWGPECWELVQVEFVGQPTDWSDEAGWPETVTFHQQRLAYGANLLKRQTVWLSKAGDFYKFEPDDPANIVDSDPVTFTLDSGTQNKIQWMSSVKTLNIGTLGNEWTVSGATREALTPTNVLAQRQTNNGSEKLKALVVNLTTLFLERHGRTINEFIYDYTFDSYKTSDLSILSNHVTEQYSIRDWTYQQTPDSIIWSIRRDGALLGITYQRFHEVIGWHVHFTDGEYIALSCIPGQDREDEVWFAVKRVINGEDRYFIEKMAKQFISEDAIDSRFLDSFLTYNDPENPIQVVAGLGHLEGKEIGVCADGTVHPPVTVSGGQVTLNNSYGVIVAGLNYTSEIWPHLPDIGTDAGTSIGRMQRIISLTFDFHRTLGLYVGKYSLEDGEVVDYIPFRVPYDLTGYRVPLFSGNYHFEFQEGYDRKPLYFLRQDQPLPFTIRAITDMVEVSDG